MEDSKLSAKKKVLEQIMQMMDKSEVEGLKAKSPKFAAVEVEMEAEPKHEEGEEKPEELEPMPEKPEMEMSADELSPDDRAKLEELYEKYC